MSNVTVTNMSPKSARLRINSLPSIQAVFYRPYATLARFLNVREITRLSKKRSPLFTQLSMKRDSRKPKVLRHVKRAGVLLASLELSAGPLFCTGIYWGKNRAR